MKVPSHMVYPEAPLFGLQMAPFSLFSHGLSYMCVVPVISSSRQNSSHIGLVSPLWPHLTLITSLFFILVLLEYGRKVMTNLDSIFKSRDITLPTKDRLVKAMVFPVVMYGCESWTIKKAECQRIDASEPWCWRRLLRVPWTARRSNQSILKEIGPGCSLEGLMLKCWLLSNAIHFLSS